MPVLYTITAYPPSIGGAQLHLHEFARRIQQMDSAAVVCHWREHRTDWLLGTTVNAPPSSDWSMFDGVPVCQINLDGEARRALRLWVGMYPALQGPVLNRISSAMHQALTARLTEAFSGLPNVVHHSRVGREGLALASLRYAREHNIPFVLTPNHHPQWRGWYYRHYWRLYRDADAILAYSCDERDELTRLGVDERRITVLGVGPILSNHANGERFRSTYGISAGVPVVLFLGQKYRYKRFKAVLDAMPLVWKRLPETVAVFVGPRTGYSRQVFAFVSDRRIVELDAVDLQTKTDALAACDILCVPSSRESFGGVYVEAGAMGKPVIAGDAPAVREVVANGVSGLISDGHRQNLANALLAVLQQPMLAREMGQAGRHRALHYNWDMLAQRLMDVYLRVR